MTTTERVALARTLADAGQYREAALILRELAEIDRNGDIGYAERMRWHETLGVLERAGFDVRAVFMEAPERCRGCGAECGALLCEPCTPSRESDDEHSACDVDDYSPRNAGEV